MEFRLLDAYTGALRMYTIGSSPAYIAASHAWSENLFPAGSSYTASPGRTRLLSTIEQLYPEVRHCWVDTLCIDQRDDADKHRQIPLMGQIFGDAEVVLIMLGTPLGMQQSQVDDLTAQLEDAITMHEEEEWTERGHHWQIGPGRQIIVQAMRGLARLTTTAWSTRVWTLQEYILARQVLWIGTDLVPIHVQDILFAALPDVCDTLVIDECIGGAFERLYGFFSGMANCRLKRIDRTRVMELLGNRRATVAADEVYGVMSAAGVTIASRKGERKEVAWAEWVEKALAQGHLRWMMLPMVSSVAENTVATGTCVQHNCIIPAFQTRHQASSSSALDNVTPLGPVHVRNGTVTVTARSIGPCKIISRLGTVYQREPNRIHRDITLILFSKRRWRRALRVASAFGAGRYSPSQLRMLAHCLVDNYDRAVRAVRTRKEAELRLRFRGRNQEVVWSDFMSLQQGQMPGMNDGVAYLAAIGASNVNVDAIIVLAAGQVVPSGGLGVLDLGGRTVDGRCIFMVVAAAENLGTSSLHKVAMTLPVTGVYEDLVRELPLGTISIGGESCSVCRAHETEKQGDGFWTVPSNKDATYPVRLLQRKPCIPVTSKWKTLTGRGERRMKNRISAGSAIARHHRTVQLRNRRRYSKNS